MSLKSSITLIVLLIGFYCGAVYAVPGVTECTTDGDECPDQYETCNGTKCVCQEGYAEEVKNGRPLMCYGDYESVCNTTEECRIGLTCMDSKCMCRESGHVAWVEPLHKCLSVHILDEQCSLDDVTQCYPFDKTFCDMSLEKAKCQCTEGLIQNGEECEWSSDIETSKDIADILQLVAENIGNVYSANYRTSRSIENVAFQIGLVAGNVGSVANNILRIKEQNGATSLTGYSLLLALSIMFTRVLA